jgi:hypothetical protein
VFLLTPLPAPLRGADLPLKEGGDQSLWPHHHAKALA